MEQGYVKAQSDNLPMVDGEMIHNFYMDHADFFKSEVRNIKTAR